MMAVWEPCREDGNYRRIFSGRSASFFYGKTAESNFIKDVASKVERVKQHDETKLEYMTLMMELKQQRREGQEK